MKRDLERERERERERDRELDASVVWGSVEFPIIVDAGWKVVQGLMFKVQGREVRISDY